jgi:hypothetical protein
MDAGRNLDSGREGVLLGEPSSMEKSKADV